MKRRKKAAAGKDKQEAEQAAEGSEDEDEDEEQAGLGKAGELQVEFEFQDPDEEDFHSVRALLSSGIWGFDELDFSGLADSIVGQGNIGTLIKSCSGEGIEGDKDNEDDTVCGMLTALNMRQFADKAWHQTIVKTLREKAKKFGGPEADKQLQAFLDPPKSAKTGQGTEVGLLISERFVNLPLDLIPALNKALLEDIEWSCTTPECPPEERPFYHFTHFICVARCQAASGSASSSSGNRGPVQTAGGPGLTFLRPEDDAYARAASFCFSFPLPPPKDCGDVAAEPAAAPAGKQKKRKAGAGAGGSAGKGQQERRAVFGLTRKAFEKVVAGLRESLSED